MAGDRAKTWYDVEGDCLDVLFDQRPGYVCETANDQALEKVDTQGNALGFSVQKVSAIRTQPLDVSLQGASGFAKPEFPAPAHRT